MNGVNPTTRKILLGCGVATSALYVACDALGSLRYPGYRYHDQEFSELAAEGSPVRPLMLASFIPGTLLPTAFMAGIWASGGPKQRAARTTVALLARYQVAGLVAGVLTPMPSRGMAGTLRNEFHGPLTLVMNLCSLAAVGVAATLLGRRFRYYSYGTIVVLAFGILTGLQIPQLAANASAPWMGATERLAIYALMLWTIAMAVALWPAQETAVPSETATLPAPLPRVPAVP
jgi:hypothetical protein